MSDEGAMSTPDETPGGGAPAARPAPAMGTAESLVAVGAILLVISEVFGNIIFNEYSLWDSAFLGAIAALVLVFSKKARDASPLPYAWTLMVLGVIEAILAVWELLDGLIQGWLRGWTIFYFLLAFVGAGVMWMGGRLVKGSAPAES